MTHPWRWFLALLLGLVLSLLARPVQTTTYYVSAQTGNDSTGDGSSGNPWKTIQHCATTAGAGNTCLIRTGTYRETVQPNADNMTFLPDTGASVTISGADVVTGWSVYSGNIYQSSGMTWTMCSPTNVAQCVGWDQVFVDGQMVHLARWPNMSPSTVWPTWAMAQSATPNDPNSFTGNENPWVIHDSNLPNVNWVGAEVTFLSTQLWSQSGIVTASQAGQITFTNLHAPEERLFDGQGGRPPYPYYLSNTLAALDTAGEWYLNTGTNTLYLWTPTSDTPANHTVEAKHRQYAIKLIGRSGITVKNINVFASAITTDVNSTNNTFDGVNVTYVWHQLRTLPNGVLLSEQLTGQPSKDPSRAGFETGIFLDGDSNIFRNCTVTYSSHSGFYLLHNHHTVTNCTVHEIDYMGSEASPVGFDGDSPNYAPPIHTSNHVVTYNTFYNTGRNGAQTYGSGILFSHNLIHDFGLINADCGAMYAETQNGITSRGEWSYNVIYNNHAPFYGKGIYGEIGLANYVVHHNVVYVLPGGPPYDVAISIGTQNNNFYNNTVYNAGGNCTDLYNTPGSYSGITARNNFVGCGIAANTADHNVQNNTSSDFVNAAAGDFRLSAGSQALNAGVVIAGITTTYTDASPAVGAYEYGQPAWAAGVQIAASPPTLANAVGPLPVPATPTPPVPLALPEPPWTLWVQDDSLLGGGKPVALQRHASAEACMAALETRYGSQFTQAQALEKVRGAQVTITQEPRRWHLTQRQWGVTSTLDVWCQDGDRRP